MAYKPTEALAAQVAALRSAPAGRSYASGLAQGLREMRANQLGRKYEEQAAENERIKSIETQRLAQALSGTQIPMREGMSQNYQTPEINALVAELAAKKSLNEADIRARAQSPTGSIGNTPITLKSEQGYGIARMTPGGLELLETPEGYSYVPDSGRMGFDPSMIGTRGAAETGVEVQNIQQTAAPAAQAAGMATAAQQAAENAALSERLGIQNAAALEQEGALAVAPRSRDAQATLSLLDMAEPLLDVATGSGLGALRDQAGALVGMSSEPAEAAAQLKAIGGLLVSKMPRMQGPQSNLDVQLYREMAGQIGDPTVPNEVRKAAMETIRQLNEKYANGGESGVALPQTPQIPQPGTVIRFDAQGNMIP
jgi:hypothetical protein